MAKGLSITSVIIEEEIQEAFSKVHKLEFNNFRSIILKIKKIYDGSICKKILVFKGQNLLPILWLKLIFWDNLLMCLPSLSSTCIYNDTIFAKKRKASLILDRAETAVV